YRKIGESSYHELYSTKSATKTDLILNQALSRKIADLQIKLGLYPKAKVQIFIVYTAKAYDNLNLGKAEIVEFSDAFYSGRDGVIYVRSQDQILDNYLKILLHEYIHWYLEQLFVSTPLWFHEGMATYHSGQLGYERYLLYLKESLINPKSDLFRIGYSYPKNKADWPRFYLSSAMAVRYMQDKYSQQWQRFWNLVAYSNKKGQKIRFSEAFVQAYHIDLWDFHQSFENYSKRQGYLYLIVATNSLIFACLPFVMLAIARKRRRQMQNMPDLPDPAQDLEDESQDAKDESHPDS
ncbi:MAG: hypothetical protein PWP64_1440, partial [Candidatus Cloacimonadota bacterium]|nr:hypothetical protein [Candidatus Cloacimonadota bacterium]